ncbi:hypothetical protein M406DRAFT_75362 [Cryphonectria parasitica EP155]|uniref:Uncharacterized protein n=1 Tax=Cryphonectria parasitica (strain ATCC 38755 / EP155) TaxID=660469 RepID=A0A9P4XS81_CRYP1|nr:uncharacterized protein M406DRAFT_75362 [Cryphonectria parasitica EP155]KAF3759991.1 hypothetical protein M406DRAFT_75362 [Cryphonectria parasitica EP155]
MGPRRSLPEWQVGDIAFLRTHQCFSAADFDSLIRCRYISPKATCHPCIVLAVHNARAIVSPISAFSTENNNFRPPWEQRCHRSKVTDHFRAFEGTSRPNNRHPALRLAEESMTLPKPRASWVYLQHFFCVPFSVLGWFDKSDTLLRVHPDSVAQLNEGIKKFEDDYRLAMARLMASSASSPHKRGSLQPSLHHHGRRHCASTPTYTPATARVPSCSSAATLKLPAAMSVCPPVVGAEQTVSKVPSANVSSSKPTWSQIAARTSASMLQTKCAASQMPRPNVLSAF